MFRQHDRIGDIHAHMSNLPETESLLVQQGWGFDSLHVDAVLEDVDLLVCQVKI